MHRYDETMETQDDGFEIALGIARDLAAMLLCIGSGIFLLFLARGM
jgi:hypothetical protein